MLGYGSILGSILDTVLTTRRIVSTDKCYRRVMGRLRSPRGGGGSSDRASFQS